jgi:hypothetical protein
VRPTRLCELHAPAQSPFCRDESRPDKWCPRKDSNLQPLVCRTSAPSIELLGQSGWWSELESNQPFGFFRPALIRLSYPTELERAVRLELTNTGFAIQRLSHLATRAVWRGRRDSNSRVEFGRLACFQLHHFRVGRESGRPAFCGGVRTLHNKLEHRTGFEPVSQHWQRRVLNQLDQRCEMVGEDRVELSPRVPRTRMRTLHHTPKLKFGAPGETRTHTPLLKRQVP